jgi:hypothetical protein
VFATAQLENDSFVPSTASQIGRQLFSGVNCGIPAPDGRLNVLTCISCHVIDPSGNPGTAVPGFFGTTGVYTFEGELQLFKVPHLRNLYQKVGMLGSRERPVPDRPPRHSADR